MSKLLTEQQLVDKIYEVTQVMFVTLSEWQAGVTIDWESAKIKGRVELMDLIQSQKLAHGEMVIGEDKHPAHEASGLEKQLNIDSRRIEWQNQLRAEQRERNNL